MTEPQTHLETAPPRTVAHSPYGAADRPQPTNLADLLERVLDKGVVLAGDIRVNLLDIELLTIKIRLLLVSVDKAEEMGIDWWRTDPTLSSAARDQEHQALERENARLRAQLEANGNATEQTDEAPEVVAEHDAAATSETQDDRV